MSIQWVNYRAAQRTRPPEARFMLLGYKFDKVWSGATLSKMTVRLRKRRKVFNIVLAFVQKLGT